MPSLKRRGVTEDSRKTQSGSRLPSKEFKKGETTFYGHDNSSQFDGL